MRDSDDRELVVAETDWAPAIRRRLGSLTTMWLSRQRSPAAIR